MGLASGGLAPGHRVRKSAGGGVPEEGATSGSFLGFHRKGDNWCACILSRTQEVLSGGTIRSVGFRSPCAGQTVLDSPVILIGDHRAQPINSVSCTDSHRRPRSPASPGGLPGTSSWIHPPNAFEGNWPGGDHPHRSRGIAGVGGAAKTFGEKATPAPCNGTPVGCPDPPTPATVGWGVVFRTDGRS